MDRKPKGVGLWGGQHPMAQGEPARPSGDKVLFVHVISGVRRAGAVR